MFYCLQFYEMTSTSLKYLPNQHLSRKSFPILKKGGEVDKHEKIYNCLFIKHDNTMKSNVMNPLKSPLGGENSGIDYVSSWNI